MSMPDRMYRIKIGSLEYGSTFLSGYFGTDGKACKSGTNNLNNGIRDDIRKFRFAL